MKLFNNPNLSGLELWHGLTDIGPLHTIEVDRESALERFLLELHIGKAQTMYPEDTKKLIKAQGFNRLILSGGRAKELHSHLTQRSLPFEVLLLEEDESTYVRRLETAAAASYIDWGQSRIKVYGNGSKNIFPRDLNLFPHAKDCELEKGEALRRFRTSLQEIFTFLSLETPLCLGLPVDIVDLSKAGTCTYQGLGGNLYKMFKGLDFMENAIIMNDAVLRALGHEPMPGKDLVLTSGFAYGGALWEK